MFSMWTVHLVIISLKILSIKSAAIIEADVKCYKLNPDWLVLEQCNVSRSSTNNRIMRVLIKPQRPIMEKVDSHNLEYIAPGGSRLPLVNNLKANTCETKPFSNTIIYNQITKAMMEFLIRHDSDLMKKDCPWNHSVDMSIDVNDIEANVGNVIIPGTYLWTKRIHNNADTETYLEIEFMLKFA